MVAPAGLGLYTLNRSSGPKTGNHLGLQPCKGSRAAALNLLMHRMPLFEAARVEVEATQGEHGLDASTKSLLHYKIHTIKDKYVQ